MQLSLNVILELLAVVTGLIYPYLAGKNKPICWLYAIISAVIYVYLNAAKQLYFFSSLQVMYVVMAVYGWREWKKENRNVSFRFLNMHNIWIIGLGFLISVGLAYLAQIFTNQRMPYFDAINFIFALIASYMITQKIMESWLYLFVLNILSVYICFESKLYLSIVLYLFLTILSLNAFKDWLKEYKTSKELIP